MKKTFRGAVLTQQYNVSCALYGGYFSKENSCLVVRIVSLDTAGLHLLTFRILEPYPPKDILTLVALL